MEHSICFIWTSALSVLAEVDMRLLKNRRSGLILPWNEHLAKHPDMREYEAPGEPVLAPKKPRRKRAAPKSKQALPLSTDVELDDLMAGIENG